MKEQTEKKPGPLMTRLEVEDFTTLSRSTIYEMMKPGSDLHDPTFPVPVRLGKKRVAWVRNEVVAWVKNCIQFHRVERSSADVEDLS